MDAITFEQINDHVNNADLTPFSAFISKKWERCHPGIYEYYGQGLPPGIGYCQ